MHTIQSTAVEFSELAKGFCAWCEGDTLGDHANVDAAVWIARLHASALKLPSVEPENQDGLPDLPSTQLSTAIGNLRRFNGMYYRTIFDPNPTLSEEPTIGDAGDDLLDTYKDVKAGSMLFDAGKINDALWHWSFLHQVHWGKHVVGALAALYAAQQTGWSTNAD